MITTHTLKVYYPYWIQDSNKISYILIMYTFTYLDENHKNYLEDKLKFYDIEHSNLTHINVVNQESILIIKTNLI